MKKILLIFFSFLTPLTLAIPAFAIAPTQTSGHVGFFNGHRRNTVTGSTAVSSTNWSGYAATGGPSAFTSVIASWTQPSLNCAAEPNTTTYSAYWVGLDGYSDQTVEQIGTEANCVRNQPVYSTWYEMYPQNPYEVSVSLPVSAGNQVTASVKYTPGTTTVNRRGRVTGTTPASYILNLANTTTGKSFTTSIAARQTYSRSSAEVITEAPYSNGILPLADYGTANYTNATANGLPLGSFANLQNIVMQNPAGMLSTPSAFDTTNKNFNVTWSDPSAI